LLFEVTRMVREAQDARRPQQMVDRIMDFGTRIPCLSDSEVQMQLDAMLDSPGTLH
jgi:hypothetical protein